MITSIWRANWDFSLYFCAGVGAVTILWWSVNAGRKLALWSRPSRRTRLLISAWSSFISWWVIVSMLVGAMFGTAPQPSRHLLHITTTGFAGFTVCLLALLFGGEVLWRQPFARPAPLEETRRSRRDYLQ